MAGRTWRRRLSNLFLLVSALILEGVALFGVRSVLAAHQLEGQFVLMGEARLELPLPTADFWIAPTVQVPQPTIPVATESPLVDPTGIPPTQPLPTAIPPTATHAPPTLEPYPLVTLEALPTAIPIIPIVVPPTPLPAPTSSPEAVELPALPPVNSTGRIVRLAIPRLGVDRAVVPLGFTRSGNGTDWATDKLFATANRKDLIGQTITSVNPGEGGNIVLMGHNYDNGYYAWEGVFVNIKTLTPGDQIIAYTEGGGEYHYNVTLVKKVPWREENAEEAAKHFKFLGPTPSEQLTLVTCGGANVWPWQARLYVVAAPGP